MRTVLWLDDERDPADHFQREPNDCISWAKSFVEFTNYIRAVGMPDVVSFDHDLHLEHYEDFLEQNKTGKPLSFDYLSYQNPTGYHCALWLIMYCNELELKLPVVQVHSYNPVGASNIQGLFAEVEKKGIDDPTLIHYIAILLHHANSTKRLI